MMKRPSSPSSAPSKKHKKSPRVSETTITAPDGEHNDQIVDSSWEKVKKRKQKKAEKRDGKLDVCVVFDIAPRLKIYTHAHTHLLQANAPRFLYSHAEIIKRRDAVGVNVSSLPLHFFYLSYLRPPTGCPRSCPSHHCRCTTTELDQSTGSSSSRV
jgi:hypothetical protein